MRKLQGYTITIKQQLADKKLAQGHLALSTPEPYALVYADNTYSIFGHCRVNAQYVAQFWARRLKPVRLLYPSKK